MKTLLVVANRTLADARLFAELEDRVARETCAIHFLVPASPEPKTWSHDPFLDRKRAKEHLEAAIERFGTLGCSVTGEVGDPRPVDAVTDLLREQQVDEVLVSTLPQGASRWLGMDVVSRIQRNVDVPVSHIMSQPTLVEV